MLIIILSLFFSALGIFISTEFCLLLMLYTIGLLAALLVIKYCNLQHYAMDGIIFLFLLLYHYFREL